MRIEGEEMLVPQPAVELYTTQEKANAVAKAAAACAGAGADFAVRRMTPAGWVEELWELWGDGRVLVGSVQRTVLVARLLEGQRAVAPSVGAARLLASFFRRYASLAQDGEAWSGADVSAHERAVLDLGLSYGKELAARGLVEPDAAAAWLAHAVAVGEVPPSTVTAVDAVEPTPGVAELLRAYAAAGAKVTGVACLAGESGGGLDDAAEAECATIAGAPAVQIPALPEDVEPLFLVPSGPAAVPAMVHDFVLRAREAGMENVLVCGPNAPQLAEVLVPALAADGIACAQRLEEPVARTAVARLWQALDCVRRGSRVAASATDAAANPLVGLERGDVRALNTRLRRDRTLAPQEVARQLCDLSPLMAVVLDALEGLGGVSFEQLARAAEALTEAVQDAPSLTPLQRKRELSVAASLGDAVQQVSALDGPPELVPEVWLQGSVRVEAVAGAPSAEGGLTVEFASPYRLNSLVAQSYDAVLLSDVNSDAFCARAGSTALDELADKLGWAVPLSPFDKQRARFAAALGAACRQFACLVPQRTPEGEEAYPAFLLKEYVEALATARAASARTTGRDDEALAWEETDGPLGLPRALAPDVAVRGEDDLVETVGAVFAPVVREERLPGVARGTLAYLPLTRFLRHATDNADELVLSPSAIEAYLACPYSWFIQRRVNPQSLDETFGPLEEGSFVHAVMAAFYEALAAQGRQRVGQAPWADDQQILAQVFQAQVAKEKEREPGSGRLVATSSSEGLKLRQLYRTLADSLRRQGRFAPGYAPWAHEYSIAPEDGVSYAGVRLNGRADRIDVNEQTGRFAVIDYKGRAGSDYNLGFKKDVDPTLPKRVQALVYAQALRRQLDTLHCAGALYLGYRAKLDKDMVAGAADETLFDGAFVGKTNVSPLNFDALLDFVEEQVAEGLRGLYESRIPQHPRYAGACRNCPVPDCAGRLA